MSPVPVISLLILVAGVSIPCDGKAIEETHKVCEAGETCLSANNCPPVKAKYRRLTRLDKETPEWSRLIRDLKQSVCNKKDRGFCCSNRRKDRTTTTTTPRPFDLEQGRA